MRCIFRRSTTAALGIIILLVAMVVISSCTVREELSIDGAGAGTVSLTINLNPILLDYYSDLLSAFTGVSGDYPVFDLDQLVAEFAQRPALQLIEIERSALGQLRMEIAFDDLNEVFATAGDPVLGTTAATEVFSFRQDGSRRELTVQLSRAAVNSFLSFAPPESEMMTQFLFPPDDGSVSQEEYQAELAWALEEYAPADEVRQVLENSAIEVVVLPIGRIESQSGGVVREGAVVFRIPILELLTLSEERVYRVVFVP